MDFIIYIVNTTDLINMFTCFTFRSSTSRNTCTTVFINSIHTSSTILTGLLSTFIFIYK